MLFLSFMMVTMTAKAQFQGQVTMKMYGEESPGNYEASEVNLYATASRIMLKGENAINFSDSDFDASGLLIRHDKKDFIVMMGESEALQFTKEELEGFFQMAGMMGGDESESDTDINNNFNYTGKEKKILGFDCTELKVTGNTDDTEVSIWLTSEIDINWGMLGEPWRNVPVNMQNPVNQLTQEFKQSNFPMLVEMRDEEGVVKTIFEVTNVNESSIAKAMVEIPSGINLISLQEMIFKMMIGN